ncbi:MAG: transcriptional regulator [Planctomycetota bacterium]|nr:MAG: transcriptional regulator [Planctomycetota bacterium]REJ92033.1 MAG: transcriptional regulator [Planctomycetota bacterium]REK28569.1 MAG: transcriptional regulator [Planctomycetota bacterium]REK39184.1 MAG: transcriptional regulator [Planctomycetota bacterium]
MPDAIETRSNAVEKAVAVFEDNDGVLKMADALRAGIHRNTLYSMLEQGIVERLSRGLYRLAEAHPLGNPDLVTVAKKVPDGVICLVSALAYHELTTQIPHEVHVAVSRNSEPPRLDYPPIRVYRFSEKAFSEGIERPLIDKVPVAIYDREKTLADCFKYRNKIGMDTVLEALRFYKDQRRLNVEALLHYASICRVTTTIRPYLESIL